jgi:hypothetical protein
MPDPDGPKPRPNLRQGWERLQRVVIAANSPGREIDRARLAKARIDLPSTQQAHHVLAHGDHPSSIPLLRHGWSECANLPFCSW